MQKEGEPDDVMLEGKVIPDDQLHNQSVAPSGWDNTPWHCIGLGIAKQDQSLYQSYTCCGRYEQRENGTKAKCCCYQYEKRRGGYFHICTPLGCKTINENKSSTCTPLWCKTMNENKSFICTPLWCKTINENKSSTCTPLWYESDNGNRYSYCNPLWCQTIDANRACFCTPVYCNSSKRGNARCDACTTHIGVAGFVDGSNTCGGWIGPFGCLTNHNATCVTYCLCLPFCICHRPDEGVWDRCCSPLFCFFCQNCIDDELYPRWFISPYACSHKEKTEGGFIDHWCYCGYCGVLRPEKSCSAIACCFTTKENILVPVADTTDNKEWNQRVKENGVLLQPAIKVSSTCFGKHFDVDSSQVPMQTSKWQEECHRWRLDYNQDPPARMQMGEP